jgi:hypothetical protein
LKRRRAISDSDSSTSKATTPRSGSKDDEISEDEISASFLRRKSATKKSIRLDSSDDDGDPKILGNLGNTAAIHTTESAVTTRSEPEVVLSPESIVPPPSGSSAAGPVANATFQPAVHTPANRSSPVSSTSRRLSGPSDETLAPPTVARPTPSTFHGKTILKPIAPIVDKHRGSRMKILPTQVTQVSSLSTKFSVAGGSAPRASSQPKSPVVSTPSINVPTELQAFPSDEPLASTFDPPLGLKAQDQMVPLSLGELSSVPSSGSTIKSGRIVST